MDEMKGSYEMIIKSKGIKIDKLNDDVAALNQ